MTEAARGIEDLAAQGVGCPRAVQLRGPEALAEWVTEQYERLGERAEAAEAAERERLAEVAESDAADAAELAEAEAAEGAARAKLAEREVEDAAKREGAEVTSTQPPPEDIDGEPPPDPERFVDFMASVDARLQALQVRLEALIELVGSPVRSPKEKKQTQEKKKGGK